MSCRDSILGLSDPALSIFPPTSSDVEELAAVDRCNEQLAWLDFLQEENILEGLEERLSRLPLRPSLRRRSGSGGGPRGGTGGGRNRGEPRRVGSYSMSEEVVLHAPHYPRFKEGRTGADMRQPKAGAGGRRRRRRLEGNGKGGYHQPGLRGGQKTGRM